MFFNFSDVRPSRVLLPLAAGAVTFIFGLEFGVILVVGFWLVPVGETLDLAAWCRRRSP